MDTENIKVYLISFLIFIIGFIKRDTLKSVLYNLKIYFTNQDTNINVVYDEVKDLLRVLILHYSNEALKQGYSSIDKKRFIRVLLSKYKRMNGNSEAEYMANRLLELPDALVKPIEEKTYGKHDFD